MNTNGREFFQFLAAGDIEASNGTIVLADFCLSGCFSQPQ